MGEEGTVRDWVGKARERIGMAVGRVPNAHSEGQSLELLCAGNTKRLARCSADNGPMGVLRQLNFQRTSAAHLFQCWATGLNGIKTHCERGRNWAIRVFTEISFKSEVRESRVKLSTGRVFWAPDFTVALKPFPSLVTIYSKPKEGGKSPPVNRWMLLSANLVLYQPRWQVFSPKHSFVISNKS